MAVEIAELIGAGADGDAHSIGRLLSAATVDPGEVAAVAAAHAPDRAVTKLGVTGPPGVGKSCLVSALVAARRAAGERVAVLCIDPSSPFSGGAILGDRIRMGEHALDPDVFIRSFGTRGQLGGLAEAVPAAIAALEACRFDVVIVETVGVGQNEVAVAAEVPACVVVLSPATGDGIQALKGGVLEVADIAVVNKADLPGAGETVKDLRSALAGAGRQGPPVLQTVATRGEGIEELWAEIAAQQSTGAHRSRPRVQLARPRSAAAGFRFRDAAARTLPALLSHQAEALADTEYLGFGEERPWTFADAEQIGNRVAHGLASLGVGFGDRVALILPNRPELVATWFGAAKLGAIEVPLNPELNGKLLAHVLANSAPRVIVCDAARLEALAAVAGELACEAVVVVDGDADAVTVAGIERRGLTFAELVADRPTTPPDVAVAPHDPLAILYTSGTTGPAKGVLMPNHQFYVFTEAMVASMGLTSADHYYTPLPLFHADAQLFGALFPLVYGARGTIDGRFSASRFWSRIRATGATATNMLGAMAQILSKADPRDDDSDNPLRVAQAIPMIEAREEFEQRFGLTLVTGYGQTETSLVTHDSPDERRAGSCGRPAPGYELAIFDEHGHALPPGQVGEIVLRPRESWTMSIGYFQMPEQTLEATHGLWWHTGDAGHFDADGWMYFDGRIKDAIRRRGENVSAYEVESIVDEHPSVLESAAVAVPSELTEDDIKVVVALRPGAELDPAGLLEYCVERMPRHMVPRYIELRQQLLPRTPSEKVAKEELRGEGVGEQTWDRERDPAHAAHGGR